MSVPSENQPSENPQSETAAAATGGNASGVTATEWLTMPDLVEALDETLVGFVD